MQIENTDNSYGFYDIGNFRGPKAQFTNNIFLKNNKKEYLTETVEEAMVLKLKYFLLFYIALGWGGKR